LKIYTNINENIPKDCIVTIGIFDGVHQGHKFLLNNLIKNAEEKSKEHLVITLWPHPGIFFGRDLKLLNTPEEKFEIFRNLGIKNVLVLEFNQQLANFSETEFVRFLKHKADISGILRGYNNSFGTKSNSAQKEIEYPVAIILLDEYRHEKFGKISSTVIRNSILDGNISEANQMLGYKYRISGRIVDGYKIGRTLGFATANVGDIPEIKLLPKIGVYAVTVDVDKMTNPAMLNLGFRPSFYGNKLGMEFHILDFEGNIYGKEVTVNFFERIRDEKRFENIDTLIEQLKKDKIEISKYFEKQGFFGLQY
jgi:riboflavin kinase/FMN adenylyltransferase